MLMWACDLIVAAENAEFLTLVERGSACAASSTSPPWEFGPRKTKELMLTGDSLGAEEAVPARMVSKIFPEAELSERTLDFARRIAELPR